MKHKPVYLHTIPTMVHLMKMHPKIQKLFWQAPRGLSFLIIEIAWKLEAQLQGEK